MAAFMALDWARAAACLTDDCLFRVSDVGKTPPASSNAVVMRGLVDRSSTCEMRIVETFVSGPIVMHERYDRWTFKSSQPPLLWHGIGIYAVAGGKVGEWIDYTLGRPDW
jgi:limonene-1,2-epoxide hydrolase